MEILRLLSLEVLVTIIRINPLIHVVYRTKGNRRNIEVKNVCLKRFTSINIKHFEHLLGLLP